MKTWMMALLATGAMACAGVSVRSTQAPDANLARYKTYGFMTDQTGKPETLADQQIRASLERDLQQKGLTPATTGNPDFLIAYHTKQEQRVEVTPGGYGWGYWGWSGYPDVNTYTQGTLIVDFIDPSTNKIFWRGTATAVVNDPNNPNPKNIDKAVGKLVSQYPSLYAATPPAQM